MICFQAYLSMHVCTHFLKEQAGGLPVTSELGFPNVKGIPGCKAKVDVVNVVRSQQRV